ncbi:hypothetical protein V2J09_016518 [Rumex salicifolius]
MPSLTTSLATSSTFCIFFLSPNSGMSSTAADGNSIAFRATVAVSRNRQCLLPPPEGTTDGRGGDWVKVGTLLARQTRRRVIGGEAITPAIVLLLVVDNLYCSSFSISIGMVHDPSGLSDTLPPDSNATPC